MFEDDEPPLPKPPPDKWLSDYWEEQQHQQQQQQQEAAEHHHRHQSEREQHQQQQQEQEEQQGIQGVDGGGGHQGQVGRNQQSSPPTAIPTPPPPPPHLQPPPPPLPLPFLPPPPPPIHLPPPPPPPPHVHHPHPPLPPPHPLHQHQHQQQFFPGQHNYHHHHHHHHHHQQQQHPQQFHLQFHQHPEQQYNQHHQHQHQQQHHQRRHHHQHQQEQQQHQPQTTHPKLEQLSGRARAGVNFSRLAAFSPSNSVNQPPPPSILPQPPPPQSPHHHYHPPQPPPPPNLNHPPHLIGPPHPPPHQNHHIPADTGPSPPPPLPPPPGLLTPPPPPLLPPPHQTVTSSASSPPPPPPQTTINSSPVGGNGTENHNIPISVQSLPPTSGNSQPQTGGSVVVVPSAASNNSGVGPGNGLPPLNLPNLPQQQSASTNINLGVPFHPPTTNQPFLPSASQPPQLQLQHQYQNNSNNSNSSSNGNSNSNGMGRHRSEEWNRGSSVWGSSDTSQNGPNHPSPSITIPYTTSTWLCPLGPAKNPNKAILTVNAQNKKILMANDMACALFSMDKEHLLGRKLDALCAHNNYVGDGNGSNEKSTVGLNIPSSQSTSSFKSLTSDLVPVYGKVVDIVKEGGDVLSVSLWMYPLLNPTMTTSPGGGAGSNNGGKSDHQQRFSDSFPSSSAFKRRQQAQQQHQQIRLKQQTYIRTDSLDSGASEVSDDASGTLGDGNRIPYHPFHHHPNHHPEDPTITTRNPSSYISSSEDDMNNGGKGEQGQSNNENLVDNNRPSARAQQQQLNSSERFLVVCEPIQRLRASITLGPKGRIFSADPPSHLIFGVYSCSELLGMPIVDLIPGLADSGTLEPPYQRHLDQPSANNGLSSSPSTSHYLSACRINFDKMLPVKVYVSPTLDEEGEVLKFNVQVEAFESISGVMTLLPSGQLHSFNTNFAESLLGYSQNELKDSVIQDILPDFDGETVAHNNPHGILPGRVPQKGLIDSFSENLNLNDVENGGRPQPPQPHPRLIMDNNNHISTTTTTTNNNNTSSLPQQQQSVSSAAGPGGPIGEDPFYPNKPLSSTTIIMPHHHHPFHHPNNKRDELTPQPPREAVAYQVRKLLLDSDKSVYVLWMLWELEYLPPTPTRPLDHPHWEHSDHETGEGGNQGQLSAGHFSQHYEIVQHVGKGAFGAVKLAMRKSDGLMTVTKFISKAKVLNDCWIQSDEWGEKIPMEIHLLTTLKHPNIVNVIDVFSNEYFYQLVMEKHGNGMDLFDFIDRQPKLDEPLVAFIFRQIVSGVSYLDSKGLVHRDIKDENVIIDEDFRCKLIDFGSAAYFSPDKLFTTFCGTMEYCSPEVLLGNQYSGPELEMWSLGVLLYTLIFLESPFNTPQESIEAAYFTHFPLTQGLDHLLSWLLHPNPDERARIQEVERHWWLLQPVHIEQYSFSTLFRTNPPVVSNPLVVASAQQQNGHPPPPPPLGVVGQVA